MNLNHIKCLVVLLILCGSLSCTQQKTNLNITIIELDNTLPFNFNEKFELSHKVQLETTDESLITNIWDIAFIDDYIYISDLALRLLVFDLEGNFIRQIGSRGQGPGEYMEVNDFYIENYRIVVIDSQRGRRLVYDRNGEFLYAEQLPINPMYVQHINDDLIIYYIGNRGGELATAGQDYFYRLLFLNANNNVVSGFLPSPSRHRGHLFDTGSPFFEHSDNLFFIEPMNDTIYQVIESRIEPILVVDFGRYRRPRDFRNRTDPHYWFRVMRDNSYVRGMISFYKFPNMVYFRAFIGEGPARHIFYDKISQRTFVASTLIDTVNNINVSPRSFRGEKEYFLSIINPDDFLDREEDLFNEDNPTLVFYRLR